MMFVDIQRYVTQALLVLTLAAAASGPAFAQTNPLTMPAVPETRAAAPAQSRPKPIPSLSVRRALFFRDHPAAWTLFLSRLPQRPAGRPLAAPQPFAPATGGKWTVVKTAPINGSGNGNVFNPLLLTDGTVLMQDYGTPDVWRLTPDNTGSYVNGTWSKIASLPVINGTQYAPIASASAVLPDGRVILMGGEYNGNNPNPVWTNLGAIYDPLTDSWTPVSPPDGGTKASGWNLIGDAASIVLPNGTFLLSSCCARPSADALFNASDLSWADTGAPTDPCLQSFCGGLSYQNEQGYTLLPNGKVMTIDVWDPPKAQQYDPATGIWTSIASTPVSLIDPVTCDNFEIGPAVTRPDGTVVAFGGNTGCTPSPADPTAVYTVSSDSWIQGPDVPAINGRSFDLADAPAVMLPNGNILFAASPGFGESPTHFFEFTGTNLINRVADPVFNAAFSGAFEYNFLMLPNGQALAADISPDVEFYTPSGTPDPSWAPAVSSAPDCVVPGDSYVLKGTQLNGLTQGAAFGDEMQGATNYPLVRIVNNKTKHVFYARTFGHSTMSIAPGHAGSTNFTVAQNTETGASILYAVANGIPSTGTPVTVQSSCGAETAALAVTPADNISASGTQGGPFSPSTFKYKLSATNGSLNYSITNLPSWLTVSSTSGTLTNSAKTIIFKIDSSAKDLAANTYINSINFNNVSDSTGSTVRIATLTINPKQFKLAVIASPRKGGTVSGGGTFPDGSTQTVTATANSGFTFIHWTNKGKVASTSASYTFTLDANTALVAVFKRS